MSTALRVALISRHALVRAGLTHLIGLDPARARVVTAQADCTDLPAHDVAIYDVTGIDPHDDGLRTVLASTSMPIVAIATASDPDVTARLRAQGIAGLVSMDVTVEVLLLCLERAAAGRRASAARLRERRLEAAHLSSGLTERELTVLELIGAGKSNERIAAELYLSINTVKSNIRTAYKRIGVTSRSQAVIWAIHHGLAGHGEPIQSVDHAVTRV